MSDIFQKENRNWYSFFRSFSKLLDFPFNMQKTTTYSSAQSCCLLHSISNLQHFLCYLIKAVNISFHQRGSMALFPKTLFLLSCFGCREHTGENTDGLSTSACMHSSTRHEHMRVFLFLAHCKQCTKNIIHQIWLLITVQPAWHNHTALDFLSEDRLKVLITT